MAMIPGFCKTPVSDVRVTLRLYDYVKLPASARSEVVATAKRVLGQAGVRVEFLECLVDGAETGSPACAAPLSSTDLVLRILLPKLAVKGEQLGDAAMTPEGGASITVFSNPEQRRARVVSLDDGTFLGHAVAHEIGHLLLGANARSSTGIMRPVWRPVEEEWMVKGALIFDAKQASKMRSALTARSSRVQEPRISVMVFDQAEVSGHTLSEAQERAAAILGKAGVEVKWIDCHQSANAAVCATVAEPDRLFLTIVTEDNRQLFGEDVLGRSVPGDRGSHGIYARVFYRHIQAKAEQERVDPAQLLGLAVAHEFGHLLLGPKAHSAEGIMRANWSRRDMERGAKGQLGFTDQQAPRIRADVQSRIEERERPRN